MPGPRRLPQTAPAPPAAEPHSPGNVRGPPPPAPWAWQTTGLRRATATPMDGCWSPFPGCATHRRRQTRSNANNRPFGSSRSSRCSRSGQSHCPSRTRGALRRPVPPRPESRECSSGPARCALPRKISAHPTGSSRDPACRSAASHCPAPTAPSPRCSRVRSRPCNSQSCLHVAATARQTSPPTGRRSRPAPLLPPGRCPARWPA